MIDGVRLKICGLTSLVDAEFVDRLGADCLGFILYPKSLRYLPLRQFRDMSKLLPDGRLRVAVMVLPTHDELRAAMDAGFDRFQIHFPAEVAVDEIARWSSCVGANRLWLAPKLPPEVDVATEWLDLADTVLMDTFHAAGFGGSGQTGDWAKFRRLRAAHPAKTWILAGGLNPENVGSALAESGANFLDLSSGVEAAPGIKDHAKLRALAVAIHRQRSGAIEG